MAALSPQSLHAASGKRRTAAMRRETPDAGGQMQGAEDRRCQQASGWASAARTMPMLDALNEVLRDN